MDMNDVINRIIGINLGEYDDNFLKEIIISIINNYSISTSDFLNSFIKRINDETFLNLEVKISEDEEYIHVEDKDYHIPCPPVGSDVDIDLGPHYKSILTKKKNIYLYSNALGSSICFSEKKDKDYPNDAINECIFESINLDSLEKIDFPDFIKNYFVIVYCENIKKYRDEIINGIREYLNNSIDLLTNRGEQLLINKNKLLEEMNNKKSYLENDMINDDYIASIKKELNILDLEIDYCDITYDVDNYNLNRNINLIDERINSFRKNGDNYIVDYFLYWGNNEIGNGIINFPKELVDIINTYLEYFNKIKVSLDDSNELIVLDPDGKQFSFNSLVSFLNDYEKQIKELLDKNLFYDSKYLREVELNKIWEVINDIDIISCPLDGLVSILYQNNDNLYEQILNSNEYSFDLYKNDKENITNFLNLVIKRIYELFEIINSYSQRKDFQKKKEKCMRELDNLSEKYLIQSKVKSSISELQDRINMLDSELLDNESMLKKFTSTKNGLFDGRGDVKKLVNNP